MKIKQKNIAFALRQLLSEGTVGTHEEICDALQAQGFYVNQPKISRLLNKMGAVKINDQDGRNIYRLPHEHGLMHELNTSDTRLSTLQWILDIAANENMIVIHTMPGAASMVAREIDLHHVDLKILGCIAGDDTIFVVPKEVKKIKDVVEKMKEYFHPE